ncbi:hypothetical protein TNCV_1466151 [Trichonephila clavipes]|nr:hypothetical protein TNCV_1466151 [Trichonephila clavipes]
MARIGQQKRCRDLSGQRLNPHFCTDSPDPLEVWLGSFNASTILAGPGTNVGLQTLALLYVLYVSLKFENVIEEVVNLARQINLGVDRDAIQEMLDSHNQEQIIYQLMEMHDQDRDIKEFESLDSV